MCTTGKLSRLGDRLAVTKDQHVCSPARLSIISASGMSGRSAVGTVIPAGRWCSPRCGAKHASVVDGGWSAHSESLAETATS